MSVFPFGKLNGESKMDELVRKKQNTVHFSTEQLCDSGALRLYWRNDEFDHVA
jgi:hypothetical protein